MNTPSGRSRADFWKNLMRQINCEFIINKYHTVSFDFMTDAISDWLTADHVDYGVLLRVTVTAVVQGPTVNDGIFYMAHVNVFLFLT